MLNEPDRLKEAPEGEVALLLQVAAAFGLTGAVRCLLDRHPSAEALGMAVFSASECGRAGNGKDEGVIEVLLEAGADLNFIGNVSLCGVRGKRISLSNEGRFFVPLSSLS